jgi:hypothetical protein
VIGSSIFVEVQFLVIKLALIHSFYSLLDWNDGWSCWDIFVSF